MYFGISKLVKQVKQIKTQPLPSFLFLVASIKTPSISQRKTEHKAKEVFDLLRELGPQGRQNTANTENLPLQQSAFKNPQAVKTLTADSALPPHPSVFITQAATES